jgi:fatty acid desaturase
MMDPPSSFIFENIPFHMKHHLWFKTKHFYFLKQY